LCWNSRTFCLCAIWKRFFHLMLKNTDVVLFKPAIWKNRPLGESSIARIESLPKTFSNFFSKLFEAFVHKTRNLFYFQKLASFQKEEGSENSFLSKWIFKSLWSFHEKFCMSFSGWAAFIDYRKPFKSQEQTRKICDSIKI